MSEALRLAAWYGERSQSLYSPTNIHADPTTGERFRLVRLACVAIAKGQDPEDAFRDLRDAWGLACAEINTRVDAAPKIKRGPCSGQSVIGHRFAYDGAIEGDVIFIRNSMRRMSI